MQALAVIEGEIPAQMADGVRHASIIVEIDLFIRDGLPYALDKDVVQRPPAPIHTDVHPARFEPGRKRDAREWRSLISIESLWLGVHERSFQGTDAEVAVEGDRDFPGHHVARTPVEGRHQGDKPMAQANVCAVCTPDLIDARHVYAAQRVWINRLRADQLTEAWLLIDGLQAHQPQPPLDPLVIDLAALSPQPLGGGLAADGGSVTIVQTAFVGNWSYIGGGFGLYGGGTMTVTNATIRENEGSEMGGGLSVNGGQLTMMNSTIAHNSAGKGGGGYLLGATTRLVNVTVADNRSHGVDGIIGGMELQNTILARNLSYSGYYGVDCMGFTSLGNNLLGDLTGCAGTPLLSDAIGEPGLADFINNEQPGHGQIPLLPMSRAIGAGNDATCPKKDQLGENRVGVCDIGAIEFQGTAVSSR
jgi:hypothetical protein